ncbi:MAG: AMP-binding protein [Acidimicrobiales bacterium]
MQRAHDDPYSIAVKDLERELTYAELIDEAARLGAGLDDRGVGVGDRVALLIPNSVDFVVAALATQWIGAVFVPLALTDPQSRLAAIVADCSPSLIVTSVQGGDFASGLFGETGVVALERLRAEYPAPVLAGDSSLRIAYMIYTSGTTGTPKGVQITRAAFAAAVQSTARALQLGPNTRTLCVSPFHFDGSYANVFPTLVSGGTVVIRPRDALLFPRTFFSAVTNERITYSGFTPSYLRLLLASPKFGDLKNSTLTTIALGGEALSVADLRALWSQLPSMRVFNRYGPTEATIAVTTKELTTDMIGDGVVSMGGPHPGVSFTLIDNDHRVIKGSHQTGELYIGGVQLMAGYWANPALSREVMRNDILAGETLYRTGDLAYRDDRGDYVYVDRVDRVVKRSGVRISLVELNASMNKIPGVLAAACVMFDREGELGIVAFVITQTPISVLELRRGAAKLIPETMLPDRFEFVSVMPLNKSNQLDESPLLLGAGLKPYRRSTGRSDGDAQ